MFVKKGARKILVKVTLGWHNCVAKLQTFSAKIICKCKYCFGGCSELNFSGTFCLN
jgi:hypothetical protein